MKKRILALAMAAVMAGSLTACSGSSGTDTKAAPAETEAPASESKSEAKEESKAGEGDAANTASSKGGSEGYELALVTDFQPFSTMKALMPRVPISGVVTAKTT